MCKRYIISIICTILFITLIFGCDDVTNDNDNTYSVSGKIIDSDENPVAGALVTLSGEVSKTFYTDKTGLYEFIKLPEGNYTITVTMEEASFSPSIKSLLLEGKDVADIDFIMIEYSILGIIADRYGNPVSNVTVYLSGDIEQLTTSDENGEFSFSKLLDGDYFVTPILEGRDFEPYGKYLEIQGSDSSQIEFVLLSYNIDGIITDSAGNPVSGATVSLSGHLAQSTTSDSNGFYFFTGLTDGNYIVTPSKSGEISTPTSTVVEINGNDENNVNFTIAAFALKLEPASSTINGVVGSTKVMVIVEMARNVLSARFTISFDPSLVEATKINTSGSGYLFTDAGANVIPGETTIDNNTGTVVIGVLGQKQGFSGADGDGILAAVTFVSKRTGSGSLDFVNINELDLYVGIYDENAAGGFTKMSPLTQNGTITVQ